MLLGWALDPSLPEALHHQMTQGAFLQFHASLWGESYQFAVNLLSKLVSDLGRLTSIPTKEGQAGGVVRTENAADGTGAEETSKRVVPDARADLEEDRTVEKKPVVSDVREKEEEQTVTIRRPGIASKEDRTEEKDDSVTSVARESLGVLESDGLEQQAEAGRLEERKSDPDGNEERVEKALSEPVSGVVSGSAKNVARVGGERKTGTETILEGAVGEESTQDRGEEPLGGFEVGKDGVEGGRLQVGEGVGKSLTPTAKGQADEPSDVPRDAVAEADESTGGEDVKILEAEGIGAASEGEAGASQVARNVVSPGKAETLPVSTGQERSNALDERVANPEPTDLIEVKLTPEQTGHLLCLLRCFESVLEALTSSLFSSGRAKTLRPFARQWLPQILGCAKRVGGQLQDATWTRECCRSLAVLAEILGEGFAAFYPEALFYLLETLDHAAGQFEAAQVRLRPICASAWVC